MGRKRTDEEVALRLADVERVVVGGEWDRHMVMDLCKRWCVKERQLREDRARVLARLRQDVTEVDRDEHRARIFTAIETTIRQAKAEGGQSLNCISRLRHVQANMLGLNEPARVEVTVEHTGAAALAAIAAEALPLLGVSLGMEPAAIAVLEAQFEEVLCEEE